MPLTVLRQGGHGHNLWYTCTVVWPLKNTSGTHCAPTVQNQVAYNQNSTFSSYGKKTIIASVFFSSKRIYTVRKKI
jgi:hypothetical protein